MATEYTYDMQVKDLSKRNNISLHKSRTFLKEYRRTLKAGLFEGKQIEVPQLATMFLSTRTAKEQFFLEDDVMDFEDQAAELSDALSMDVFHVYNLLKDYAYLLVSKLTLGYKVMLAGVFHLTPVKQEDGTITVVSSISQSLEKPEEIEIRENIDGVDTTRIIPREKQIYRLIISEDVPKPERVHIPLEELSKDLHRLDDNLFS